MDSMADWQVTSVNLTRVGSTAFKKEGVDGEARHSWGEQVEEIGKMGEGGEGGNHKKGSGRVQLTYLAKIEQGMHEV